MISVIGLDPGSEKSAFVLWSGKQILDKGIHPNEELLNILSNLQEKYFPVFAIESMVSIPAGGGKSIIQTIEWADRFYQAWPGEREKVPVYVIKKALGAKDDPGIRIMLIRRFGAPGNYKHPGLTYALRAQGYHLWRAFAVAVIWLDHLEFQGRQLK